jgi:hypothetical protein
MRRRHEEQPSIQWPSLGEIGQKVGACNAFGRAHVPEKAVGENRRAIDGDRPRARVGASKRWILSKAHNVVDIHGGDQPDAIRRPRASDLRDEILTRQVADVSAEERSPSHDVRIVF